MFRATTIHAKIKPWVEEWGGGEGGPSAKKGPGIHAEKL